MKNNPVNISIVLAVKNESEYIDSSIKSIATQDIDNFEIIIINDNSDDDTAEKILKLKKEFNNIVLLDNDKNGKVAAFNYGVSQSRGDWVCLFAGDDIMPQDSLKKRYNQIKNLDQNNFHVSIGKIKTISNDKYFDSLVIPKKRNKGLFSGQCYLMNKKLTEAIFPVNDNLPNEDTWISTFLKYAKNINIYHSNIICCYYRIHDGNSMRKDLKYSEYNKKINLRHQAFKLITKFKSEYFSSQKLLFINQLSEMEKLRFKGNFFSLLFYPSKSFEKLRFLINSNKNIYKLKIFIYKYIVGKFQ